MKKMSKSAFIVLAALMFLAVSITPTYAQDTAEKMGSKLKRGVVNIATGWIELFNQPRQIGQEEGFGAGATKGLFMGASWAVARTAIGVWDTGTFLFPIPADYEPILEPETLF